MGLKYTKRAMTSYEVHRFFHGLEISFFPDTYFFILINQRIDPKFGSTFPLECNQLNDQQFDHSS